MGRHTFLNHSQISLNLIIFPIKHMVSVRVKTIYILIGTSLLHNENSRPRPQYLI